MRRFDALLAACALVTIAPLFAGRFLPFSDMPEHVAAIGSLRHWFDPAWRMSETYSVAWGESQYLLYHLVGAALAFVVGTAERANLLLLAIVGFTYPFAARALLRSLGRDERLALFACPLFWSHALSIGFLPFVASVPLAVFSLSIVARQMQAPTRRRFVALSILGVVLLFAHVCALLVVVSVSFAFALTLPSTRRLAELPRRTAWLVPGGAMFLVWCALSHVGFSGRSIRAPGQIRYAPLKSLPGAFTLWSHDLWSSHVDEALAIVFWLVVASIVLVRAFRKQTPAPRLALWAPFACALVFYLVMPFSIGAGDSLNVRFGVFLPIFVLLVLDLGTGALRRMQLAGAVFLTVASAMNNAIEISTAQLEIQGFEPVLEAVPPRARLLSLDFSMSSKATRFPAWVHLGSYHYARSGGVSGPSFRNLGHWPIHFRPEAAPPDKRVPFWEFSPCLFRNAEDGAYYDHVLVRGLVDPFRDDPPGPVFRAVRTEGDFTLYERIPGLENPAWDHPDRGPCFPRGARSGPRT